MKCPMRAFAMTGMLTASWMPAIISGSDMRATPPSRRMSAGTRSSAMTAAAPASSATFACSGSTTSMMTPPLSISARPVLTRKVDSSRMRGSLSRAAQLAAEYDPRPARWRVAGHGLLAEAERRMKGPRALVLGCRDRLQADGPAGADKLCEAVIHASRHAVPARLAADGDGVDVADPIGVDEARHIAEDPPVDLGEHGGLAEL